MRTIKELLILLREKLPEYIPSRSLGLCGSMINITLNQIITLDEYDMIREYIDKHKPGDLVAKYYWWHYGELAPRLEFLDKLIAEL